MTSAMLSGLVLYMSRAFWNVVLRSVRLENVLKGEEKEGGERGHAPGIGGLIKLDIDITYTSIEISDAEMLCADRRVILGQRLLVKMQTLGPEALTA